MYVTHFRALKIGFAAQALDQGSNMPPVLRRYQVTGRNRRYLIPRIAQKIGEGLIGFPLIIRRDAQYTHRRIVENRVEKLFALRHGAAAHFQFQRALGDLGFQRRICLGQPSGRIAQHLTHRLLGFAKLQNFQPAAFELDRTFQLKLTNTPAFLAQLLERQGELACDPVCQQCSCDNRQHTQFSENLQIGALSRYKIIFRRHHAQPYHVVPDGNGAEQAVPGDAILAIAQ